MTPALDGIRRVGRAPAILAGMWLLTLAVSLPLGLVLRGMLAQHLGASLEAHRALTAANYDWMQEFAEQASGLGVTFKPTIIGFGAVLDNLSAFLDDATRPLVIVGTGAAYLVLWLFAAGGIIDRYARDRATRADGFFAACGRFFFRFLRLGVAMGIVYGVLFSYVHRWMFGDLWTTLTRDVVEERRAFAIRVVLYLVFGAIVGACNLIFDYAKVRAVVEDRRSMLGAVGAAVRFVRRHARETAALYLLDVGLFLIVVVVYALVAPGAGGGGASILAGFAIGQLYVVGRLWVKLVFWATEVSLFQSRLAHAGYVAAPLREWPDSAAAEAIARVPR